MRISEQRYTKERRVLDLATRLIDFEARTGTIRELTGMVDGRIRSLSKTCGIGGHAQPRQRHRGAAPHRVHYILGKARSKNEAAALMGVCDLMGVTGGNADTQGADHLGRAEQLCDAFWTFRYLLPDASIGFEHMLLLLSARAKGEELLTAHCHDCNALLVVDPLSLYSCLCEQCSAKSPLARTAQTTQLRCVAEESPAYM